MINNEKNFLNRKPCGRSTALTYSTQNIISHTLGQLQKQILIHLSQNIKQNAGMETCTETFGTHYFKLVVGSNNCKLQSESTEENFLNRIQSVQIKVDHDVESRSDSYSVTNLGYVSIWTAMQSVDVEEQSLYGQELCCQSQFWEVTFLDLDHHILRRPLFVDFCTMIHGSYNLFEQVKNILLRRAVRSCFLISNLFIFKKKRIQLLKVPQSSQMYPRSSNYSKFSHDNKDYY
ncbi:Hypothetical_protein [Hexamita inflata]|uniref:Hypothetical_protein n=1 Tax=Hexamita inflata TaxID=28002 RepID=A0AA86QGB5_9EUKA|nr:Hypothetical protein HINF_LOCUS38755 [Hexamita inflata]